ncbi:MAG TPA: alpha/beta fold hydrolase, partial [Acidimicrobiales bacterium]|nr:alpha/beta fold hydrolase [Acidimicrobiales bacterium]
AASGTVAPAASGTVAPAAPAELDEHRMRRELRQRSERIERSQRRERDATSRHGRTPVLFLHGWGVGPSSYTSPLARLGALGCDVTAPAQPGFGGRASLPADDCNFAGYARWAAAHLDELGVDEPVVVVGHSFGGGVAIQFAHDHPERVRALVVCNGVGGFTGSGSIPGAVISERPWWEWGRQIGADLLSLPGITRVLPALIGQALPNLVTNPMAMWRVGEFVRRAHLLEEVSAVARRLPVTLVWSDRDHLVPSVGFTALCRAAGIEGWVVPGHHSWLIAEPRRFADVVWRAMVDAGVLEARLAAAV